MHILMPYYCQMGLYVHIDAFLKKYTYFFFLNSSLLLVFHWLEVQLKQSRASKQNISEEHFLLRLKRDF